MPRKRRTKEEAHRVILDAAEARLLQRGPAGIRLQEVAADVGMSHPAILHHFGSREGLVDAVLERAVHKLRADLVDAFNADSVSAERAAELMERVFETLGDSGHARTLAWLIMAREEGKAVPELGTDHTLLKIATVVQALQQQAAHDPDDVELEDTVFSMMLAAFAIFGDAIAGGVIRHSAGMKSDDGASTRFRRWLAQLLRAHLERHGRGRNRT